MYSLLDHRHHHHLRSTNSWLNATHTVLNKSSAVAEMGDRLATIDMRRKWGGLLCPFLRGGTGSPSNTCRLGRGLPPYQVASWSTQPLGMGRKLGGVPPFLFFWGGELDPHLTQYGQHRGLPPCQVASWSIEPFGHNTPTSQTERQDRTRQRTVR